MDTKVTQIQALPDMPQVLRKAVDIMRVNGRHVGGYFDVDQFDAGVPESECRVCVAGAINLAAGLATTGEGDRALSDLRMAAVEAVTDHLGLKANVYQLASWQDKQVGPEGDEVVFATLLKVADELEAVAR